MVALEIASASANLVRNESLVTFQVLEASIVKLADFAEFSVLISHPELLHSSTLRISCWNYQPRRFGKLSAVRSKGQIATTFGTRFAYLRPGRIPDFSVTDTLLSSTVPVPFVLEINAPLLPLLVNVPPLITNLQPVSLSTLF
jgi:hypothetical protein